MISIHRYSKYRRYKYKINKKNESIRRLAVVKLQNITKHKHTKQNEKV